MKKRRLSKGAKLVVLKTRGKPEQRLAAFITKVYLAASGVCEAYPLRLTRRRDARDILLALHGDGAHLQKFGSWRDPQTGGLTREHCVWSETVAKALPVSGNLTQSATAAV